MKNPLPQWLNNAGRLVRQGDLMAATRAIQTRLAATGPAPLPSTRWPASASASAFESASPPVIDVEARRVDEVRSQTPFADRPPEREPARSASTGHVVSREHVENGRALRYRLFVPPAAAGAAEPAPLIVMLHGCTQTADDFAAGTRMDALAAAAGCFVLYPEQNANSNPQRCWNWFKPQHQQRGRGEPAALAGMVRAVLAQWGTSASAPTATSASTATSAAAAEAEAAATASPPAAHCSAGIDPQRVFVAGLSAGGAMAAILGQAYPELFAAVGVHSGLPVGAAHDVASAFAAMQQGGAATAGPARATALKPTRAASPPTGRAPPTIVFHGDADATVHPRNGDQVTSAVAASNAAGAASERRRERSANGREATRHLHRDAAGRAAVEHWTVHGAGHAWSGGSAAGSYTDGAGPDASAEMLRFFLEAAPTPAPAAVPARPAPRAASTPASGATKRAAR